MSDHETEFLEEPASYFTQAGALNEPSLCQLRDQIKKVMIPLLIKTFQCKVELNQSLSLPSRIQSQKSHHSPKEIQEQLKTLDNDLKVLLLWCQSCQSQIHKALIVPEEEQKNTVTTAALASDPAVTKSFSKAVSAQASFFQQRPATKTNLETTAPSPPQRSWWKKLFKK